MTALGKLFRTTAFKLSLAYLAVFAIGATFVLGGVAWNVNQLLDDQIGQTVEAEITGLAEQYEVGGIRQLVEGVERRAAQPGSSLYLVTDHAGQTIAGNVATLPEGVIDHPGLVETTYQRTGEPGRSYTAMARIFLLSGGFRLMVGRDLDERENLRAIISHALLTSLLWLVGIGALGGIVVARRVLRRVDMMTDTARTIMTGDLTRRLPVGSSGDELDRLALNLNAMLDRIGVLVTGMREVSDNIAHDLRTPLTRLRNRAEEALRTASSPDHYREALDKVIEEADRLMDIFAALLLIARAEAGTNLETVAHCDVGTLVRDVVELYEPAAEEAGLDLVAEIAAGLQADVNRELVGQAVANLIDNALKYGATSGQCDAVPFDPRLDVTAEAVNGSVEIAVRDHGVGIAAADRTRVLDRFVRLEAARTKPGSGLGLSLVAAVAHLHGGSLRLEDGAPGLRAVLVLPRSRPNRGGHAPFEEMLPNRTVVDPAA